MTPAMNSTAPYAGAVKRWPHGQLSSRLTAPGFSHEKLRLIAQIALMYSTFFGRQVRATLLYQWRQTPAFELRRVHAHWQALLRNCEAKRARAGSTLTLFK